MFPELPTIWGAERKVVAELVNQPVSMLLTARVTVKVVFGRSTSPFTGNWNLEEGRLVEAGRTPMGAGLHDPSASCVPLVRGLLTVKQKLIQLLLDVPEGVCPGSGLRRRGKKVKLMNRNGKRTLHSRHLRMQYK